jgi:hypothetical protein
MSLHANQLVNMQQRSIFFIYSQEVMTRHALQS